MFDEKSNSKKGQRTGSPHEKQKQELRDEAKRRASLHSGIHYVEIRNYPLHEECPTLWNLMKMMKQLEKSKSTQARQTLQEQINLKIPQMNLEVYQQILLQCMSNKVNM